MTVRLRAHHLLCMLTFAGDGYSQAFVANFWSIVARIGAGEEIALIDGPDDVCAPLEASDDAHCAGASAGRRDRAALLAIVESGLDVDARPLTVGGPMLERLHALFRAGTIRAACRGCEWNALCTAVAEGGPRAPRRRTSSAGATGPA